MNRIPLDDYLFDAGPYSANPPGLPTVAPARQHEVQMADRYSGWEAAPSGCTALGAEGPGPGPVERARGVLERQGGLTGFMAKPTGQLIAVAAAALAAGGAVYFFTRR